jgi:hypothetical protein
MDLDAFAECAARELRATGETGAAADEPQQVTRQGWHRCERRPANGTLQAMFPSRVEVDPL